MNHVHLPGCSIFPLKKHGGMWTHHLPPGGCWNSAGMDFASSFCHSERERERERCIQQFIALLEPWRFFLAIWHLSFKWKIIYGIYVWCRIMDSIMYCTVYPTLLSRTLTTCAWLKMKGSSASLICHGNSLIMGAGPCRIYTSVRN